MPQLRSVAPRNTRLDPYPNNDYRDSFHRMAIITTVVIGQPPDSRARARKLDMTTFPLVARSTTGAAGFARAVPCGHRGTAGDVHDPLPSAPGDAGLPPTWSASPGSLLPRLRPERPAAPTPCRSLCPTAAHPSPRPWTADGARYRLRTTRPAPRPAVRCLPCRREPRGAAAMAPDHTPDRHVALLGRHRRRDPPPLIGLGPCHG